jgi:hypothetical protein
VTGTVAGLAGLGAASLAVAALGIGGTLIMALLVSETLRGGAD